VINEIVVYCFVFKIFNIYLLYNDSCEKIFGIKEGAASLLFPLSFTVSGT
jgi:hypothetical protein